MPYIMNNKPAKQHRRQLRRDATFTERILWKALRVTRIDGVAFRRQVSVEQFVVDFYVPKVKLAIELDGPSHTEPHAPEYDAWRQKIIEGHGIEFIRFRDEEVLASIDKVVDAIEQRVREKLALAVPPAVRPARSAGRIAGG